MTCAPRFSREQARPAPPVYLFIALMTLFALVLGACLPWPEATAGAPTGDVSNFTPPPTEPAAPTEAPATAATPTPQPVLLTVPEQFVPAAAAAVEALSAAHPAWSWQLDAGGDPALKVSQGAAHIGLTTSPGGIPVGARPLAFVVPFTSEWGPLIQDEAGALMQDHSPFVAALDWENVGPPLKALRVDGLHPGEAGYPIVQNWYLSAAPGYQGAAEALAPGLAERLPGDEAAHLVFVGDIMLDRSLGAQIEAGDVSAPFADVSDLLTEADLTIGNFESALGGGGRAEDKGYTFLAPPPAAEALAGAGFDLLSVANNHALDYGVQVFHLGRSLLEQAGIVVVGAGENESAAHAPAIFEAGGLTLAFLAYVDVPVEVGGFDTRTWRAGPATGGVAWAEPERIQQDVAAALEQADLVIVLLHSGYEGVAAPSPPQLAAARAAVEAGAHLVVGHHAHVLQGVAFAGDAVVAYGLGNFAFDDGGSSESAILNVWVDVSGVRTLEFLPVTLTQDGHPVPASEERAAAIHEEIIFLSKQLH